MKPSNSKAALAARQRKSRQGKKDKAERARQHAAAVEKLDIPERILIDQIVKAQAAMVKAHAPARIAAVIEKTIKKTAAKDALKSALNISEPPTYLSYRRPDSDGRLVEERIPIPQHRGTLSTETPHRPAPPPVIVVDNGRPCQGQGDPTIKKVLIQRQGTGRKEWCLPDQIPRGAHVFNPEERGRTGFAYGVTYMRQDSENYVTRGWTAP